MFCGCDVDIFAKTTHFFHHVDNVYNFATYQHAMHMVFIWTNPAKSSFVDLSTNPQPLLPLLLPTK